MDRETKTTVIVAVGLLIMMCFFATTWCQVYAPPGRGMHLEGE